MIFFGGKKLWISCSMIHKNFWCQCSKSNDYHEYFQWDCSWSWTALFLEAIESIIPFKPFLWTRIWKLFIVLYFILLYILFDIEMYGWVIAAMLFMLLRLLREEGMLQIAFSWISQKVGFTNKRKHDPPKRENIFNLASDKIPGKMVPGCSSIRERGCCL